MLIPDHEIDEPSDAELCGIHDQLCPCPDCFADEIDRRYEGRNDR
jgi:hypothetical protein